LNDTFARPLVSGRIHLPVFRKRVPEAKGTQDFIGINYYTRELVAFNLLKPKTLFTNQYFREEAELSENKWIANEPEGLFEAIRWGLRFNIPIIITENGIEDSQDVLRRQYMIQHIHQVWRAVNYNWPVKGYIWWTLVDNFEWERGWTQRFGLWELDKKSQSRRKRPSADLYAAICRENGISSEMVQQFAPQVYDLMFP
jgi:beta-glucosidase